VRVIPIQSGRLVGGYAEAILKRRILRLNRCLQHVVLVADGRNGQPVKMKIRGCRRHQGACAGTFARLPVQVMRSGRVLLVRIREIVPESQRDQVAGICSERGRFITGRVDVAVASRAVCLFLVALGEIDFELAISTVQFCGLGEDAPDSRTRAARICGLLSWEGSARSSSKQKCECRQDQSSREHERFGVRRLL
jgi:hypothetical protein